MQNLLFFLTLPLAALYCLPFRECSFGATRATLTASGAHVYRGYLLKTVNAAQTLESATLHYQKQMEPQVTELGQESEHLAVEMWLIEQHVQR